MTPAPIVLFVYNRPWHTRQTVEALKKNEMAKESELFIFSDGSKSGDEEKVEKVREYIKTIDGFKKITIIEREKNWGLASNIIDGVTTIVNQYGKIIVLEDDLATSPYFLRFMNEGLEMYKDEEKVMHISGYMYPIKKDGLEDVFFIKPTSGWGWATWDRAWKYYKKDVDYYLDIFDKKMIYDFNLNNSYKYFDQIIQNKQGKLNTWGIFWYASVYLQGGLSLHPKESYVLNIGFDEEGTHCKAATNVYNVDLIKEYKPNFTKTIVENIRARKALEDFFNSIKPSFISKVRNKLQKAIKLIKL
ncbi:glycosyltransferase [Thermodesulfovibrio yellowstonii]|uniref:Glycosyl transferase n=1 Tax=Thermodesulfovibrio yellowstonii TaxID=28262 RepID=A0A9W6LKE2_9BACT|nr:glycosyltransferase [Thermodesulfovibrio islandicus]GLI54151.1 glycosyl transferase [Thermodesulfovibrio islandicus]